MSDIRINALATTASTTASDDYIAIDGSANGTRKLSAYSPTFGGNLTVSGTGTSSFAGKLTQSPTLNANADNGALWSPTITPLSGNIYINRSYATINSGASAGGFITEFTAGSLNSGTSNIASIEGFTAGGGNSGASGTMASYTGFRSSPANTSTGSVTNVYGFRAQNVYNPSGYVGNQYGVYVDALTGAANNYAFYSAGTAPSVLGGNLTVSGTGNNILNASGGNLLVGRTTNDALGKLQVEGSLTASEGANLGLLGYFGGSSFIVGSQSANSVILRTNNTTALTLDNSQNATATGALSVRGTSAALFGATTTQIGFHNGGSTPTLTWVDSSQAANSRIIDAVVNGGSYKLRLVNDAYSSATNLLTIDTSGNATFTGLIKPQQAPTASAPAYVKGAIYFDTTLNKLRVGGATAWETITST